MSWEALIMQSKTSFFNATLFRSDLKRYWPLTAGYTLLWLLVLPLSRLTELNHDAFLSAWNVQYESLGIAVEGGIVSALVFGILFAMAAFSYLTNPRATNGMHALGARRETLFVTHYLAGLASQLAPQLLAVLLTEAVLAAHGQFNARLLALMCLGLMLPTLFFYSFGAFCMIFTGQILAAPVFYGALNVLVVGVEGLVKVFAGNFLYGWTEISELTLDAFSPLVRMLMRVHSENRAAFNAPPIMGIAGVGWLWFYAAVGLAFAALGLLVYRRRHSEATGSIVAIGWARPIFRYGVSFCAALALGQLLYYLFFGQYRASGDYSLPGTLACMAAAGLIGYFAAEMLLRKSFRVWKQGWKGAAAVAAALVALGLVLSFDLAGYEKFVPDPARIQNAEAELYLYGNGQYTFVRVSDPDALRALTDAHRAVVADKAHQLSGSWYADHAAQSGHIVNEGDFTVAYTLADGRRVRRSYDLRVCLDEQGDPASLAGALNAFYNSGAVTRSRALGDDGRCENLELSDVRFTGGSGYAEHWKSEEYLFSEDITLTAAQARQVYEAVLRDVAAGRAAEPLGKEHRSTGSYVELYAVCYDESYTDGSGGHSYPITFTPQITEKMTETVAALRAAGVEVEFHW